MLLFPIDLGNPNGIQNDQCPDFQMRGEWEMDSKPAVLAIRENSLVKDKDRKTATGRKR
jgi:hypothetical protein